MIENFQLPPHEEDYASQVHGWSMEAVQEGEYVNKSSSSYARIQDSIDYVMGEFGLSSPTPATTLKVIENRFGKIFLEGVSAMTDIKPFWQYRTDNDLYKQQMDIFGKLSQAWWLNRSADLEFANVLKFGWVAGTGFGHLTYDTDWQDMRLIPEDPRDVLPIRPASLNSIQDCFGVILRRERPVNHVKEFYPAKAHLAVADREAAIGSMDRMTRAGRSYVQAGLLSGFMENLRMMGQRPAQTLRIPVVDVYTLYVKDLRLNTSSQPVVVQGNGPNDISHRYIVEPGEKLFPRGRCIVFTRRGILRDGPSIYWHGKFPLVKFTIDPMPWSWLGKAPLYDLLSLQEELNRLHQVVAAHNARVRKPGIIADKNAVPKSVIDKLDTSREGLRLRHNPTAGRPPELIYEPPLDPSIQGTIEDLRKTMDELSGVADVRQLMQLNQIPNTETIEKMLESMTLTTRIRSRVMEVAMREFAMMQASNFLQFYTLPMRVAVLGPTAGQTFEDFDLDPGNMIPQSINPTAPRETRAREFLRQFKFHISPSSLLEASKITTKLMYIQLARAGWCDIWTLGERLDIPEMGAAPQGAVTIPQRLVIQNLLGLGMAVSPAGRKASGQQMPQVKGGGISESGQ